jgi:hypothetical protein
MTTVFWPEFAVLFVGALLGSAAVMPYALKLLKKSGQEKQLKLSLPNLILLSFLQAAVLSALAVGFGLLAAHAIGLGAPYIEAALTGTQIQGVGQMLLVASITGALAGLVLLLADLLFLPHWPQALVEATTRRTTMGDNFLASFYGGINEEIFIRLFGFSVLVWILSLVWHTSTSLPTNAIFWTANIVMTIVFGLGHLPALKNLIGKLSPLMITRSLLLNTPVGLLCGWLFWTYGIEAAVITHFLTDIVYHVFGTMVLNRRRFES